MKLIYCEPLTDAQRVTCTARLFGLDFPLRLEPAIFTIAQRLSRDYVGGHWQFFGLSNEGFYMAPTCQTEFRVDCSNGFEGQLSADALGITACMYAYSQLSFGEGRFAETCAEQFHLLRGHALDHREAAAILRAID